MPASSSLKKRRTKATQGSNQISHIDVFYDADDPSGRARYAGQAIRGVPHGAGEMTWRPGGNYRHFVGYFTRGEMTVGRLWFGLSGESSYIGHLADSKADGFGALRPGAGEETSFHEYFGHWWEGHKHGLGTARFLEGRVYMGRWDRDCMHGTGQLQWADGTVFRGQFVHDEPHGWGNLCLGGRQQAISSPPDPGRDAASIRDWADSLRQIGVNSASTAASETPKSPRPRPAAAADGRAIGPSAAAAAALTGTPEGAPRPESNRQAVSLPAVTGGIHISERFVHGYPAPVRVAARVATTLLVLAAALFLLPHALHVSSAVVARLGYDVDDFSLGHYASEDVTWGISGVQDAGRVPATLAWAFAQASTPVHAPRASGSAGPTVSSSAGPSASPSSPSSSLSSSSSSSGPGSAAVGSQEFHASALQDVLRGASLSRRSLSIAHLQSWAGSSTSNSVDGWGNCWGLGWLRKHGGLASVASANSVSAAWRSAGDGAPGTGNDRGATAEAVMLSFLSRMAGMSHRWGSYELGGSGAPTHQPALLALGALAQCGCRVNATGSATSAALLVAARRAWQASVAHDTLTFGSAPAPLPSYLRLPAGGLGPHAQQTPPPPPPSPPPTTTTTSNNSDSDGGGIDVTRVSQLLLRLSGLEQHPRTPGSPEADTAASFADAIARSVPGMRHLALYWRRACRCGAQTGSGTATAGDQPEALSMELSRAVAATELSASSAGARGSDQGVWRRLRALLAYPSQLIAPWSCLHAWAEAEQHAEAGLVRALGLGEVSIRGALLAGGDGWLLRGSLDGQGVVEREQVVRDTSGTAGGRAKARWRPGNSTSGSLTVLASDPASPTGLWDSVVVLAHLIARDALAGSAAASLGTGTGTGDLGRRWRPVNEEEALWESTGGRYLPHWLADPHVVHGEEGGRRGADEAAPEEGEQVVVTTWSSLLALLCVYARLHLRQQIHLLRFGMMVLFACTGDLEDAVATIIWTSLCLALRVGPFAEALLVPARCCLPMQRRARAGRGQQQREEEEEEEEGGSGDCVLPTSRLALDDTSGRETLDGVPAPQSDAGSARLDDGRELSRRQQQATAEHCAYLSAVVLGFCASVAVGLGVCIALPEFCSEVARTMFAHRLELRSPSGEALAKVLQGLQAAADAVPQQ